MDKDVKVDEKIKVDENVKIDNKIKIDENVKIDEHVNYYKNLHQLDEVVNANCDLTFEDKNVKITIFGSEKCDKSA